LKLMWISEGESMDGKMDGDGETDFKSEFAVNTIHNK